MPRRHPVKKIDAEKKIKKYIDVLKEAKKYEASLPVLLKEYFKDQRLSFVFYKNQLDAMYLVSEGANAIRIYLSANEQTVEPTLVIVPCYLDETTAAPTANNKLPNRTDDGGEQYPSVFSTSLTSDDFDLLDD